MSFASRFKAGSDIAKDLVNTYQTAKEQGELDKINQSKQTESEGFTPEDDAQRLAMQNAKKPDGTPYYDITTGDEKGGYGVKMNFTTKDASGADVVPADIKRDPVKMYDFMGKRSDKPLTEAEQTRGKERASIDVLARRDPKLGLQMRAAANAEDRAEQTFEIGKKASGLQLEDLERKSKTAKAGELAEQASQDYLTKATTDPVTGKQRQMTFNDLIEGQQVKAFSLFQNGQTDAGEKVWSGSTEMLVKNVMRQEVERTQALSPALAALQANNPQPMIDVYNKYIPDGHKIKSIETGKDGTFTINRIGIDGKDVAPMSVKLTDIVGQFEALKDPKYIITAAQTAFANQLAARKLDNEERKNDISERKLDAAIGFGGIGGIGGGGSGGGGKGGKAAATPLSEATDFLKDAMEKSETKASGPDSYTKSLSLLAPIYKDYPTLDPRVAAAVAASAHADSTLPEPKFTSLQINPRTGMVAPVYRNPDLAEGQSFNLTNKTSSIAEMEKKLGKDVMKQATADMLAAQKDDSSREDLLRASQDPAYLADLRKKIKVGSTAGAEKSNLESLESRVNLIKLYGLAPQKPASSKPPSAPVTTTGLGLGLGGGRPTDPNSPAGRFQARQASEAGAAQQRSQSDQAQTQKMSSDFQTDKASMAPIDLARKYTDLRTQLNPRDAAALQAIEKQL